MNAKEKSHMSDAVKIVRVFGLKQPPCPYCGHCLSEMEAMVSFVSGDSFPPTPTYSQCGECLRIYKHLPDGSVARFGFGEKFEDDGKPARRAFRDACIKSINDRWPGEPILLPADAAKLNDFFKEKKQ